MSNQEAKFILGAYRPDGQDANDPAFREALAQAAHDPELRAWFEQQRKFDTALSVKLQQIVPSTGLREAIITGARISSVKAKRASSTSVSGAVRSWWTHPASLAAAAALMLATMLGITFRRSTALPTGRDLAAFATRDLDKAHDEHLGYPASLGALQTQLANLQLPLTKSIALDLAELRSKKCRAVKMSDGREVFELCFQRDGIWFHLYVGKRSDFAPAAMDPKALMRVEGIFASTAWADELHVYALVTSDGTNALKHVI